MEREPSWELIVFCLVTGMKLEPDDVDARDGVFSRETAIVGESRREQSAGRAGSFVGARQLARRGRNAIWTKTRAYWRGMQRRGSTCFVVGNDVTRARRELLSQG